MAKRARIIDRRRARRDYRLRTTGLCRSAVSLVQPKGRRDTRRFDAGDISKEIFEGGRDLRL